MPDFFDIRTIFFTVWDYPMSYLEFFGATIGAVAVWLSARANIWSWPTGAVSVLLFFFLFYQIQLYPDMFLQIFFFVTNVQGWWRWTHPKRNEADSRQELRISRTPSRQFVFWTIVGVVATVALGTFATNLHAWFPVLFNKPSAFPYLDSFTTVMSILATLLMVEKRVECWYVWLIVDSILTYMYFVKGVKFVGIEYFVFCFVAIVGAWTWTREYQKYPVQSAAT